jgi:hypothetical protein
MEWALKIGVKGDKKRTSQYCCCAEAIYGPDLARTPRGPTIPIVCGWGSCWEIYMECKGAAIALPLAATTSIVYQHINRRSGAYHLEDMEERVTLALQPSKLIRQPQHHTGRKSHAH